ncbi:YpoC family protein [Bacillus rubiinfantis]|uniref:YpoC family protein n=1 Tax=Bacillus rubiinfantis TaxID=1499680 RepID=UPI0006932E51|nr:hypothetical protein [Bacillus rubiinfantis]
MSSEENAVSSIMKQWGIIKKKLDSLHHDRHHHQIKPLMEEGISLFIQLLFLTNEIDFLPGTALDENQLTHKPVNLRERLDFIIARPQLYHSFRQLSELMAEMEKLQAKKMIQKKSSSRKS